LTTGGTILTQQHNLTEEQPAIGQKFHINITYQILTYNEK